MIEINELTKSYGDHLAVDADAFDALTRHLARQRHRLWTATLIEVADHVRAGRHV